MEKNYVIIEDLQNNLRTNFHASIVQSYKKELLSFRNLSRHELRQVIEQIWQNFLKQYNPDKRLKVEGKKLLEIDINYVSDNDRISESDRSLAKFIERQYSEKVTGGPVNFWCVICNAISWNRRNHLTLKNSGVYFCTRTCWGSQYQKAAIQSRGSNPIKFTEKSIFINEFEK